MYIDPEALKVFLDMFEGPLDLLLYLIRKQNLDILSIPIAQITEQYINYINNMQTLNIDLASEYLLMAAMLIAIKSRLMLPKVTEDNMETDEDDPRNDLIKRLLEYEKVKHLANQLDNLPTADRDFTWVQVLKNNEHIKLPDVVVSELSRIWQQIITQSLINNKEHHLKRQELSVREHMNIILKQLSEVHETMFFELFDKYMGISYIVVNFIAILELCKEGLVNIFLNNEEELKVKLV